MTNPYTTPPTPPAARTAPRWARKRYVLPALALAFFIGIGAGGSDTQNTDDAKAAAAKPQPTVTVTATATETADPEPAPTVTETRKVKVKVTVTAKANTGSGTSGGSSTAGDDGSSVYYANCSEARAAGAAPIHRGEPGYASHLDRDGDGIGCDS
jgi:hypothetical protein